ncbi:MAG: hypothetical protein ACLTFB_02550, partial [Candidatus Phytoplasma pyri]
MKINRPRKSFTNHSRQPHNSILTLNILGQILKYILLSSLSLTIIFNALYNLNKIVKLPNIPVISEYLVTNKDLTTSLKKHIQALGVDIQNTTAATKKAE